MAVGCVIRKVLEKIIQVLWRHFYLVLEVLEVLEILLQ